MNISSNVPASQFTSTSGSTKPHAEIVSISLCIFVALVREPNFHPKALFSDAAQVVAAGQLRERTQWASYYTLCIQAGAGEEIEDVDFFPPRFLGGSKDRKPFACVKLEKFQLCQRRFVERFGMEKIASHRITPPQSHVAVPKPTLAHLE